MWVTRRLSRLIEEADHPVQSGLDLPGPFPAHGADEVARLGRALNRMRDRTAGLLLELQNQDEARRRWITQVSHDIRTPLAALSACLDRAHRLAANGQLQQHGVELLTAATHDANRVQSLAEDLLEVARLQAGEPLNKEILMPEELLGNIARGFGPLVEAGGLKLQLDVASPLPDVYADGRLLLRALENLLRNAQRHAQSQIQLRAFATDSKQLQIEVWDDGSGFNVDVGRLEDRRLEELRKTADSTGLGLQLTRQVIEAHDGTVELAQSASGGAGVIVCLPLANGQSNST